jgi:hypothetical protein
LDPVRDFSRDDICQVAHLWLRVFHRVEGLPARPLEDYFRQVFFDNPWSDAELPSLVYEERGRIVGFLGVIPRWMVFNGRRLRVAVASQLIVDEPSRAYVGAQLMRRLFAGPQDLAYSDGANEFSERLWRACGGDVAMIYSLQWTRILRPMLYARRLVRARGGWHYALAADVLGPACHAFDALVACTGPGARWLPDRADCRIENEPADHELYERVRELAAGRRLQPGDGFESFRWLLHRAAEKKMYGSLRKAVVHEPGGGVLGWYLYYVKPGAIAQVLQFGARPRAVRKVLNCLFYQARSEGAVAISGGLEPRYTRDLAASRCEFGWPGCAVVAHTRDTALLNALHRGDAFVSRLEGEWWARFSDADWARSEPKRGPAVEQVTEPEALPINIR